MAEQDSLPSLAGQLEQIRRQLAGLTDRVERIETRLGMEERAPETAVSAPKVAAPAPHVPAPCGRVPGSAIDRAQRGSEHACRVPGGDRLYPAPGTRHPRTTGDWERLIGGRWALWVGSVAVFLAVAFFLAYTWQALPQGGRLAIGFLAGMAFLAASGLIRERVEAWFGEGLAGAGLAILYLSIWTGAERYGLLPFGLACALMVLVTATGVVLSLRYGAASLCALATLGGFLTPVVIHAGSGGAGPPLLFLTYVALLGSGILAVSLFRRWRGVTWMSFAATLLLVSGWAERSLMPQDRGLLFAFVTLYFLLFLGAACFHSLMRGEPTDPRDLLLLFADAFLYALAGYGLLWEALGNAPGAFALALVLAFALLAEATRRLAPENPTLRDSAGGIALFFLTIAVPMQLRQGWIAIAWSAQATLLLGLGLRFGSRLLHHAGQILWALSLAAMAWVLLMVVPERRLLFLNERALPLLVSLLGTFWMAWRTRDGRSATRDELAGAYAGYSVLGGAWLIAQETYLWFDWRHAASPAGWQESALFTIAALWALYAGALFAAGLSLRHPRLRAAALVTLFLTALVPVCVGLAFPAPRWAPLLNPRWLAYLVVGATVGFIGRLARRAGTQLEPEEHWLAGRMGLAAVLLLLWGVTQETYETFGFYRKTLGPHWERAAQMGVSLVWSVSGALLLAGGVLRRYQPLRLLALGLLGATVLKVFLFDLGFLDMPYRIVSFAGLGAALIGISWLYSRYGVGEVGR